MTSTPTRLKAVSFNIPGSQSSLITTSTQSSTALRTNASPKPASPLANHRASDTKSGQKSSPLVSLSENASSESTPTAQHGAKPDLVADIIESPKTTGSHQKTLVTHDSGAHTLGSESRGGLISKTLGEKQKSSSPLYKKRHYGGGVYSRSGSRAFANTTSTRERSPLLGQQKCKSLGLSNAQVAQMANQVRGTTNSLSHEHTRVLKYDAARLREQLLRIEEEIKNLNRGRGTLELAIQDVRKALSVNQQSISTQQKKSSRGEEDSSVKLLREEASVLSRAKRSLEQHLQTVRQHLQCLDSIRRNLKTKASSLSRLLELDAQNLKVYDGPTSKRLDSRPRHYATGCPEPKSGTGDEAIDQMCSKAAEAISTSRTIHGEIKPLVVSVQASKNETHGKICTAISKSVEQAKIHKREMLLERGQVRLAQNSANHQKHNEEIALGIALGPVSELHRSVSEKSERPLSRMRPVSAAEERISFNKTATKLTRQLSATSVRASKVCDFDRQLSKQLREGSQLANYDSQTLRVRKMSLDNRWVN